MAPLLRPPFLRISPLPAKDGKLHLIANLLGFVLVRVNRLRDEGDVEGANPSAEARKAILQRQI
jgi:hypothetical protein